MHKLTPVSSTTTPHLPQDAQVQPVDQTLSRLIGQVLDQKRANVQKALKERTSALNLVMIGGDVFSMADLAFQGILLTKPSFTKIPAIAGITLACGAVAGAINIGVAIICLKEGLQALKNGDKKLAARLLIDFVCFLVIGAIMILSSLALQISALTVVTAFFAANPWLLPVLFFLVSIPVIAEVGNRILNIARKKDWGSELNKKDLFELTQGQDENNPFHLEPLRAELRKLKDEHKDERLVYQSLSRKMEILQADMGVEAAIETFELLKQALNQTSYEEQRTKAKKEIEKWNFAQYVRLFQQILYTGAFGVSMGTLINPRINTPLVNSAQMFSMSAANAVPFYMDLFWPFKRNTPMVVPMAS